MTVAKNIQAGSTEAPGPSSRYTAARLLADWFRNRTQADRLIGGVEEQRGPVLRLLYGALRQHRSLAWLMDQLVKHRPRDLAAACLHVGLLDLLLREKAPDYVVLHETVEAARALTSEKEARFVNAILRRAQREKPVLLEALSKQRPGVRWSHPDALWDRWAGAWGEEAAGALCRWNNLEPSTVLRPVFRRTSLDDLQARFLAEEITLDRHPAAPEDMLVLPHGHPVSDLPGYDEGLFTVQDPATLAAPRLLAPQAGERVLDACAAPGGKTALLADMMKSGEGLWALEKDRNRFKRLQATLTRLGLENVRAEAADASAWVPEDGQPFDAILLDVPCSNTGVLRRRPDARWGFSADKMQLMGRFQEALLNHAAELLKPGGRLVYSTCSLEEEENGLRVRNWLANQPAFALDCEEASRPPDSGMDGAYAARLLKAG